MSNRKLEYSRGEQIAGKYEVVDLLDQSPLGFTYRVKQLTGGKYLRLTLLHPNVASRERKQQIIDAYKKAKEIRHETFLKVDELGEQEGIAYFTTEDFDGRSLRELIAEYRIQGKKFALREAAQIVLLLLEGLELAHSKGIVFRGLRPEYIYVTVRPTGPRRQNFVAQVRIFGLGFWDLIDTAALAEEEFTRGEAQYMGPELKSFEPTAAPRNDLYSAGVIFYEMLVGTAPIGTFQLPKTKRPDLPDHINGVIEMALANSPEDRYQSARDFVTDIQRTFQDEPEDEVRRPLIVPLAIMLGMALVALVAVILWNLNTDVQAEQESADNLLRKEVQAQQKSPPQEDIKKILANHPANMVYVPAGPFIRGRMNSDPESYPSEPEHEVVELKAFLIDAFEFPNLLGGRPQTKVTQVDAEKACASVGKRLCSADEWEKACKGPKNYIYSYGDTFDKEFCGDGAEDVYLSGAKTDCSSGYGAFDLSGNFREWTSSSPKPGRRVVKGGEPAAQRGFRCAFQTDEREDYSQANLSFRCCRDEHAPPVPAAPAVPTGAPAEGAAPAPAPPANP